MAYKVYFEKEDGYIYTRWCGNKKKLDETLDDLNKKGLKILKIKEYTKYAQTHIGGE